jgi:hypothetical protein
VRWTGDQYKMKNAKLVAPKLNPITNDQASRSKLLLAKSSRLMNNTRLLLPIIVIFISGCVTTSKISIPPPRQEKLVFKYPWERIKLPHPLILPYRGIYLNYMAATKLDKYLKRMKDTEINCVVIDFKNDNGFVTYNTSVDLAQEIGACHPVLNIEEIIKKCQDNNIWLIGRIVVFKDSILVSYNKGEFAVRDKDGEIWRDRHGVYWTDQYSRDVRQYNIDIAKDLAERGVREIQFDYIRFPSHGDMEAMVFPHKVGDEERDDVIAGFLKDAVAQLKPFGINVAGDVYGYTLWLPSLKTEGQRLEKLAKYLDVICPMLYPSHFHKDFMKSANPREYHIVYESLLNGEARIGEDKFVAYIQGFDWRSKNFGSQYIENQLRAVKNAGARGYIVWNAKGNYSTLFSLLKNKR